MQACQDAEVTRPWLSVAGSSVLVIWETSDSSRILCCSAHYAGTFADPWLHSTYKVPPLKSALFISSQKHLPSKNRPNLTGDVSVKKCPKGILPLARNLLFGKCQPGHWRGNHYRSCEDLTSLERRAKLILYVNWH